MSDAPKHTLTRRKVLAAAPLVGAAAVLPHEAQADEPRAASTDPRHVQLHDTAHIRKFYELARG
ncbi:hypothetical protein [Profundibacterium mesophilum]|uniref:Twin arginine translocation signal domain containing protein n=1 Tax=Profundibacterium mesophilum KAUST100406-0324 TaxID=1037889 RepID=A0A921TF23_9RHOB|nr:hypothetical protein [Profundibacterium mesophilum]KAF0676034.1 Twin arginine translocation signal domain containing protein [Profundibacterium mesophilum KAUST100406-0324]